MRPFHLAHDMRLSQERPYFLFRYSVPFHPTYFLFAWMPTSTIIVPLENTQITHNHCFLASQSISRLCLNVLLNVADSHFFHSAKHTKNIHTQITTAAVAAASSSNQCANYRFAVSICMIWFSYSNVSNCIVYRLEKFLIEKKWQKLHNNEW